MRLKSSNKNVSVFLISLIVLVLLLVFFKLKYTKTSKYPQAPQFEQISTLGLIQLSLKEKHYKKLKKKRDIALSVGILETSDSDYVPATVTFNGKEFKADIRLKGDWTDHLVGDKWSFRIKLKDDKTILGMRKFSIHHPNTRGNLNEWLFHKATKAEGLIGLRYNFVEGAMHIKLENSSQYINKPLGLYAIEETFDKRTIESNKRKESVIIKFSEDFWWNEVKKSTEVGVPSGILWDRFMNQQKNLVDKFQIVPFSEEKTLSDSTMYNYFKLSKNLLDDLRSDNTTIDKVFDVKKLAMHNAILNVFGAVHSTYSINVRFYYNPITSVLEPITFDGDSGSKLQKYAHFRFLNEEKDSVYLKELAYALHKVVQPSYVEGLIRNNEKELNYFEKELKREFNGKLYSVENYTYNQSIIAKELLRLSTKYNLTFSDSLETEIKESQVIEIPKISNWKNKSLQLVKNNATNYKLSRKDTSNLSYLAIMDLDAYQGDVYEVSITVKKSGITNLIGLRMQGEYPNTVDAVFNLDKGTLLGIKKRFGNFENEVATITSLQNGWYKCTIRAKVFSDKLFIIMGPTDGSREITNWEASNKTISSMYLDPSKTTVLRLKN